MAVFNVLVTRPEPGASRTAQCLSTMGYHPIIFPLSKIMPLTFEIKDVLPQALIATSAAVFLHFSKESAQKLFPIALFCVGERTAEAAKALGFSNIVFVAPTAVSLVEKIKTLPQKDFVYLSGRVRQPDLEQQLLDNACHLTVVEVYDTHPIILDETHDRDFLKTIDAVLLYSSTAAKALNQMSNDLKRDAVLLCMSLRIAHDIPKNILNAPLIAYEPNEDAMLEGLETVLKSI